MLASIKPPSGTMVSRLPLLVIALSTLTIAFSAPVGIYHHAYSPEAPANKLECFKFTKSEQDENGLRLPLESKDSNPRDTNAKSKASNDLVKKSACTGNGIQKNGATESGTKTVYADNSAAEKVVASGVGNDEKSALKDAFRNAVEQVVGMVVDSTVQAENDEIIRDQILTASDGFIKEFKTVSSEVQDGLTRVQIRAVVERKSLVQKLEAKQVIVKKVDMDNLFAKVASDAQAVEGVTQILTERLTELHKAWTATASEPTYDRNSGVLTIPLTIATDPSAYTASAARLTQFLDKIAIRKDRRVITSIEIKTKDGKQMSSRRLAYFASSRKELSEIKRFADISNSPVYQIPQWKGYKVTEWLTPKAFDQLPKNSFWIWVCLSERNFTSEWAGFAVDADIEKIGPLLFPSWSISMQLRDQSGSAIGSYENLKLNFTSHFLPGCDPQGPNEPRGIAQIGMHPHLISMGDPEHDHLGSGQRGHLSEDNTSYKQKTNSDQEYRFQCLIGPMIMSVGREFSWPFGEGNFAFWKQELVSATFKISTDDIKDITKTEISIIARPRTAETK